MAEDVDRWLGNLDGAAASDRRNGACRRNLLSELGDIELKVSRTRRYCPVSAIRSYARRAPEIDRAILTGFVPGLSTRKVGETLLSLLGRPVAPTTVSRVAKTLDAAVQARRPLTDSYKALMLDGVVLSRKTGAGALKRPVLVVLGLRPDGRKEIVDYRLARAESAAEWERFLDDLLTCFRYKDPDRRRQVRTTNAIERREVRRRTLGAFQDRTSMDRILFAIFIHENKQQGISTLFPLTHKQSAGCSFPWFLPNHREYPTHNLIHHQLTMPVARSSSRRFRGRQAQLRWRCGAVARGRSGLYLTRRPAACFR